MPNRKLLRTWRQFWHGLSRSVRASLMLQIAAIPLLVLPRAWPWVTAWLFLHHAVLSIAGTVPRSRLLGPNQTWIEDVDSVALTFDDGPDPEVTPAVLDILDRWHIKASFFVIGERVAQHPELTQDILRRGHRLENHTQRHSSWFSTYGPKRLYRELAAAQAAIVKAGAPAPTRFRAPAGVRSAWLEPVLQQLGLHLTSWSRRGFDTSQRDPERVLRRLTSNLRAGEILLLHDGNAARTTDDQPMVLVVLEPLLAELEQRDLKAVPLTPVSS